MSNNADRTGEHPQDLGVVADGHRRDAETIAHAVRAEVEGEFGTALAQSGTHPSRASPSRPTISSNFKAFELVARPSRSW